MGNNLSLNFSQIILLINALVLEDWLPVQSRLNSPDETACSIAKTIVGRFECAAMVTWENQSLSDYR